MSVETTILNELENQLLLIDSSLAQSIFQVHNEEEQPSQNRFIRLSLADSSPIPMTINGHLRQVVVLIHFSQKSADKARYDSPSDLKDLIYENLPIVNRPYWFNWETISETYDIENPDEYEGFILELVFSAFQTLTCQVPEFVVTDDEYTLISDGGELIYED